LTPCANPTRHQQIDPRTWIYPSLGWLAMLIRPTS